MTRNWAPYLCSFPMGVSAEAARDRKARSLRVIKLHNVSMMTASCAVPRLVSCTTRVKSQFSQITLNSPRSDLRTIQIQPIFWGAPRREYWWKLRDRVSGLCLAIRGRLGMVVGVNTTLYSPSPRLAPLQSRPRHMRMTRRLDT